MSSANKQVAKELLPLIRVYTDGSVERLLDSPYVPPSLDPETGVSSKDITISHNPAISARLYLPKLADHPNQKLPILVYYHGSGFCFESAFSFLDHRYLNNLVSQSQVIAISVEYRLAPEHLLPVAYEDCWAALQWVASHGNDVDSSSVDKAEPWLLNHGDFDRFFIGGDSAGGNIAHNIAMKAGKESLNGGVKIFGAFLVHPYFWGTSEGEPEAEARQRLEYRIWEFVYPSAPGGIDNPMINPVGGGGNDNNKANLGELGCKRMLVCVAEKDSLRDRGVVYFNAVKESGFGGDVELFEINGEDHVFHITDPHTENAEKMLRRLASFLRSHHFK